MGFQTDRVMNLASLNPSLSTTPIEPRVGIGGGALPMDANSVIKDWPGSSKQMAQEMIKKYGEPDEVSDTQLV